MVGEVQRRTAAAAEEEEHLEDADDGCSLGLPSPSSTSALEQRPCGEQDGAAATGLV